MNEGSFLKVIAKNKTEIDAFIAENEYVYRFLPLERFLETLQKKQFTFVSPSKWNDPFDNFLFRQQTVNEGTFLKKLYVLCVTHNPHSQAYWKTYSPEGYTVRLKIKTSELFASLLQLKDQVWFGKMHYMRETKITEMLQQTKGLKNAIESDQITHVFLNAFLSKRMPFKYEEESRIIIQSSFKETGLRKINIHPLELIKDIYLDPRMGNHETLAWKEYLKQFGIPVMKSLLFQDKRIVIQ